ncbi:hypothetical protein BKK47_02600 [Rodentibacter mrazii]|uniref:Dit-like phage tail protein N-terminal domain-containing protein n=1 Tax=Rodentibacter mrazii TaxID=1908257 RepID=A0A1V3IJ33_9PAST|nr:hypothetical protein [Rodentibacter mrazii]OOF40938.1 hypothetical protein BKK47_02600 [Rodentibacter mrazii]
MLNFVQVSNRRIGKITFDVVSSEDHQSNLSITENPIESGAAIADHAVIQPKQVAINGIMVDHDHNGFSADIPYLGNIRGGVDFLNRLPLPINVVTKTAQTLAKAGRILSQSASIIKTASDAINGARKIAPFLPDFSLGGLLDSSLGGDGRVQQCYADLLASQKSGETIDIQTGIHLYKDMLIQSIAVNQSQDGSATFTITAREIFIVETQTTSSGTSAAGKDKSGRAATQSATKTQQGMTQPVEKAPKKTSALFNIFKG